MTWEKWYDAAIAAVSEGFCPHHRTPLSGTGWCRECGIYGAWWGINRDNPGDILVVITYANPESGIYPEPPNQPLGAAHA